MSQVIKIMFPGKKQVHAITEGFTIKTDQPPEDGGDGSAPCPYDLFMASIGTCAGSYVKEFCDARSISTDGVEVTQKIERESSKTPSKITIEIKLPESFPSKYRKAVVKAASACTVKRTIQNPPEFQIDVVNSAQ